jgi:DNA-binding XRE family transcriptional regulator
MSWKTMMDVQKQKKLEAAGWKIGNAEDFLELDQVESSFIALKIPLSQHLKTRRQSLRLTQKEFAGMIHSSQSRVAKMEAGDPGVSLDLLVKSLLTLEIPKEDIEKILP